MDSISTVLKFLSLIRGFWATVFRAALRAKHAAAPERKYPATTAQDRSVLPELCCRASAVRYCVGIWGRQRAKGRTITDHDPPVDDLSKVLPMLARVRVPDGRIGEVIGFYQRPGPTVLVRLESGEIAEFRAVEVVRLSRDFC
jgi:hypothetical protein